MAFEQFPYTNFHDLNLDWILQEVKTLSEKVDQITADILGQANAYTDEQILKFSGTLDDAVAKLQYSFAQLSTATNQKIEDMQAQISGFQGVIDADIAGVNAQTDLKIAQSEENIKNYINSQLIDVRVINYFTGKLVTIQQMFDYLAHFHLENAITFDELALRAQTYDDIDALNMTYSDLALNGANIIPV